MSLLTLSVRGSTLDGEVDPRTERLKFLFVMAVDPYSIGIQMKRKEPSKTFMMISN